MPLVDNALVLILLGAAISLVTSVVVTGLQARHLRRDEVRAASRASARSLTGAFIAERDSGDDKENYLADAELTVMTMTDRKTRERLRDLVRLLRERTFPEIEELSGVRAERARQLLCEHALEVLGAHMRSERLPDVPPHIRKMLSIEEEALSIRSGEAPRPAEPVAKSSVASRPRHTGSKAGSSSQRKGAKSTAKGSSSRSTTATEEEPKKESAFWDD